MPESGGTVRIGSLVPPHFRSGVHCAGTQGNHDEETAGGRTDRRLIFSIRGKGSGTCRSRCLGRRIGSGGPGTCGRGGGCVDRIYRRAFDRAFLGCSATGIVLPCSTCNTRRYWNTGAGRRQGKPVADCRICGDASGKKGRATARSGIGVTAPASGSAATLKKFDTSGKSPAHIQHRKNWRARAGKPAAGFFNRTFRIGR
jgi:hypothetical protein